MDVQQQFEGDLVVIGVPDPDESIDDNRDFVDRTESGSITHLQNGGAIWSSFDVARRQTYILVSADGSAQLIDFDNLASTLDGLLTP